MRTLLFTLLFMLVFSVPILAQTKSIAAEKQETQDDRNSTEQKMIMNQTKTGQVVPSVEKPVESQDEPTDESENKSECVCLH